MSKINKLTINETTYTIEDPTAARVLMVEMDEVNAVASHRATDIVAHISQGPIFAVGEEILIFNGTRFDVTNDGSKFFATFKTAAKPDGAWTEYTVDDNGALTVTEMSFATADQIGDIETALDGILAIQNELIGGDA